MWWFGFFIYLSGAGMNGGIKTNFSDQKTLKIDEAKIISFLQNNLEWLIFGIAFLALILILFVVLGTIARGGLISSIGKIIRQEPATFKSGWKIGKSFFWRVFGIGLVLNLIIIAAIIILVVPVAFLFYSHSYIIGAILAILALLIMIPLFILTYYIKTYAAIYAVQGNLPILSSLENATSLFQKNFQSSLVMGIILFGVSLAVGAGMALSLLFLLGIFLLFGTVSSFIFGKIGLYLVAGIGIITLLTLIFFIQSVYQVFSESVWVFFFREIAIPKEEEKAEEIIVETSIKAIPTTNPVKTIKVK